MFHYDSVFLREHPVITKSDLLIAQVDYIKKDNNLL
jgi:hypothetical protein